MFKKIRQYSSNRKVDSTILDNSQGEVSIPVDPHFLENLIKDLTKSNIETEERRLFAKLQTELVSKFEQSAYYPYPDPRYRSDAAETALDAILAQFPWAATFVIDTHQQHLPHVLFTLREVEHILQNDIAGNLSHLRLTSVVIPKKPYTELGCTDMGLALQLECRLKNKTSEIEETISSFSKTISRLSYFDFNKVNPATTDSFYSEFGTSSVESILACDAAESLIASGKNLVIAKESALTFDKLFTLVQAEKIVTDADQPVHVEPPRALVLSDGAKAILQTLITSSDKQDSGKFLAIQAKIAKTATYKLLATVGDDVFTRLQPERFPNFAELISYLEGQFCLARMADSVFRLPPLLLIGPPGVGKTEFLTRLAQAVDSSLLAVNMSSAQTSSALAGSDIHWGNARPGRLFETLVFGPTANPIVFLDEIDKINKQGSHNPEGALFALLERHSAAKFEDLCLPGLKIDASHVVWFASANAENEIDPAILSRFRVFNIPEPTKQQMPIIIQSVYQSLLEGEKWGSAFPQTIPLEVMDVVGAVPPRMMRQMLEGAIAAAAMDGRKYLQPDDLQPVRRRMAMGF